MYPTLVLVPEEGLIINNIPGNNCREDAPAIHQEVDEWQG